MGNFVGLLVFMAILIGGTVLIGLAFRADDEDNHRRDQICYPLAVSGIYTDRLTHKERVVCALPDGGVEVK